MGESNLVLWLIMHDSKRLVHSPLQVAQQTDASGPATKGLRQKVRTCEQLVIVIPRLAANSTASSSLSIHSSSCGLKSKSKK
mmetsp:Transcript_10245/g.17176  ORF Transcript_10245/g.17176 Transcript_10245/m.17176 type:complete len:82 (-) Transcript_10245:1989-2234(-)